MKSLWILFALLIALSVQAQPYTVTEDGCRMFATDGSLDQSFLIERLMWVDRGSNSDQIMIFDGISALVVQDADLANYPTTDSLIEQMKVWIVECDTAGTAPGPVPLTALFANQKSIDLDGLAEYVTVADADDLSMTEGGSDIPFSVAAWVYDTDAGGNDMVVTKGDGSGIEFQFYIDTNEEINFFTADTDFDLIGRRSSLLTLTQWNHIAGTYDGSETNAGFKIYLNGVKVDDENGGSGVYDGIANTATNTYVGWRELGSLNYGPGKLDQVCIFRNVELTLQEIKELMSIRDVTQFTYYDSLVLYQEYDNDTTGTNGITDLSPAGNNGTMQAGEYTDLNLCVEWPYSYQLDSNTTYSNLTPMQSSVESDSSFGGFGWDFDGAIEYTDFGDVTDYDGLTELSISAWVKSDVDFTTTYASIVGKDDDPDQRAFVLSGIEDGGNNTFRFLVSDDGTNTDRVTSGAVDNRQFNHVVGTWDTDSMKIYVNGILSSAIATTNATTGIANTTASLRFAKTQQPGTYLNGTIGDVFIYNGLLTHTQVKAIYKRHAPRNETNESLAGNIVGYWRGYNATNVASGVLDQSGNGLHGTPTNMDVADFQYTYPREIFDADTAGSVDFDGTTEYISVADSDSLSMLNAAGTGDTAFSISAWINMDVVANFIIASKYGDDATREWYLGFIAGNLARMVLYDESENAAIGYNTTFAYSITDQWVNLIWTYDGSGSIAGMNFYANGIQKSSFTDISSGSYTAMENLNTPLNIGHLASGSPIYSNGQMAHVTIMKGIELDLCQVQEINNGKIDVNTEFGGSPVDPRNWTFWSDDFIHYKLDQSEDLETTEGVTNISPNGSCNGTATNMTNAANKITTSFPTN